jgi:hypothetical protein
MVAPGSRRRIARSLAPRFEELSRDAASVASLSLDLVGERKATA